MGGGANRRPTSPQAIRIIRSSTPQISPVCSPSESRKGEPLVRGLLAERREEKDVSPMTAVRKPSPSGASSFKLRV